KSRNRSIPGLDVLGSSYRARVLGAGPSECWSATTTQLPIGTKSTDDKYSVAGLSAVPTSIRKSRRRAMRASSVCRFMATGASLCVELRGKSGARNSNMHIT
ncbi:MAG: hypothetical protein ACPHIZ_08010, partial [Acidimicrobiales bacterium]